MDSPSDNLDSAARIAANIQELRANIGTAARQAGRPADSVRLVGVSKTVGPDQITAAIAAGLQDFGENRSQPFKERQELFPQVNWHFIGHIQTNKIKEFIGRAALIHSVASEHVLGAIQKQAAGLGLKQPLLLEVNVLGEASKDGVTPSNLPALLEAAAGLSAVQVLGLMTMAPISDATAIRRCFVGLRELLLENQQRFSGVENLPLQELSMGMSDDFPIAVAEGATIVRIGRSVWR